MKIPRNPTCRVCNIVKSIDNFKKNNHCKTGHSLRCKECDKAVFCNTKQYRTLYSRQNSYKYKDKANKRALERYYENHKKLREYSNEYYKNNRDKVLEARWKKKGILNLQGNIFTAKDKDLAMLQCKGLCELCGTNGEKHKHGLVVDHDHNTNLFRGILCGFCNSFLGQSKDNIQTIENAIKYLKKAKENNDRIQQPM